jgi:hypothetical protein
MKTSNSSHGEVASAIRAKSALFVLAAAVLVAGIVPARADLLAHWTFDEASGTVAHDSANSLDGTLSSTGASFVSGGISGNAVSLNRPANGYVNMGNVLSLTSGDFSVVAWVKMNPGDTTLDTIVLGKQQAGYVNGYLLHVNPSGGGGQDNKALFYAGGLEAEGTVSKTSVNDGNWHQVVGVYNAGVNKVIYVDGVAEGTNSVQVINGNSVAFLVGGINESSVPSSRYTGLIDDVQVYDHALGSNDVYFLFTNPGQTVVAPPPSPRPVAHWTFDESGGTVAHDSASGLDGTLSITGAGFVSGGISSNAVSVNRAANGFVNMGNVLPLTSGDFSIVLWLKMNPGDTTPDTIVLGKQQAGSVNGYLMQVNPGGGAGQDNKALFYAGGLAADGPVSKTSVNDGNWHQVVGVYKSGLNKVIYVDGLAEDTNSAPVINGSTAPFLIGGVNESGAPASRFTGMVDDVQVYDYALDTSDILSLFQNPGKVLPISPCTPQPSGLISWWPGDGNANDVASTNHGSFVNPSFSLGKVGQAFDFNGAGNNVRIPASPNLDVGTGNGLTVEAWVNPADQSQRPVVEWAINGDYAVLLWANTLSSGSLYAGIFGTDGSAHVIQSTSVLQSGTFQHVAVTYDKASGVARLLRNGVIVAESNFGTFTPRTGSDLYIGYRPAGSPAGPIPFLGQIDEVSIYNRALSPGELQAIYDAGGSGKCGLLSAPSIISHPASRAVFVGATLTFSVMASGTAPLTYQWRFNGSNVLNATEASLVLTNVQITGSGSYSVVVSNVAGTATSSNAVLTVNPAPPCAAPPVGLVSWWPGNGDANDMVSGNTGTFVGASFADGQVGQSFSFDGSGNHVRVPASASLNVGAGNGLTVEAWINPADSSPGPIVEWAVNGAYAVLLWANSLSSGALYGAIFGTDGSSHIIQSASGILQANSFQHVAMTYDKASGIARLLINGSVAAESSLGTYTPRTASDLYIGHRPATTPAGPVSFNGKIDEVSIYSRALATAEIQAIYNAGVSGKCVVPIVPFIIAHPQSLLVAEGGNASFSVAAGGTPPLSYQWSLNGTPLANATNASLALTGVTTSQAGDYSVLVSNLHGQVTSSNATLTVRVLGPNLFDDFDPEIDTMQWAGFGGTVRATNYGGFISASNSLWFGGTGSRFATTRPLNTSQGAGIQFYLRLANGGPPLWERVDLPTKGIVLESSTNSGVNWTQLSRYDTTNYTNWTSVSLVIPPGAQAPNTQFRWRQLLNSGSTSDHWALDDVAVITGPVAPFILSHPTAQTVIVGGTATFSAAASGTLPLSYQWRFNETNVIAGATNNSLVLTNVQLTAAGAYSVVITNAAGSVTSSNALLTVNLPPATVAVTSLSAESATAVSLPLTLAANGNENAAGFSLNFDPAKLSYTGVALGSGASAAALLVNTNELATGKLGVALALPTDTVFAAGAHEILRVGFTTAILTSAAVTTVGFGDVPISRLVSGTAGNVLSSAFTSGTVSIAAANYEGDITPRPDGDRNVVITDWVLEGRYAARLDYPTNATEFQRADCAPRATLGDGLITVTDWVQAGRYAAALDPLTVVGGPSTEGGGGAVQAAGGEDREISVTNGMLLPSQTTAAVGVQLKAVGDENALGFSSPLR